MNKNQNKLIRNWRFNEILTGLKSIDQFMDGRHTIVDNLQKWHENVRKIYWKCGIKFYFFYV